MCWWPVIPVGDVCVRVDSKQMCSSAELRLGRRHQKGGSVTVMDITVVLLLDFAT